MAKPVSLQPHQRDHFARILGILSRIHLYIDGSAMGTGKTYIAAAVSQHFSLPCIVVCQLSARRIWQTVLGEHGIPVYDLPETGGIISYDTLRSRAGHQPKHGLLTRVDNEDGAHFYPTVLFSQLVQQGVLLVFDECQKLKNTSDQHKAAKALIAHLYAVAGKSRVAFLSGTFLDQEIQVVRFLRLIGFINSRNLYTMRGGESQNQGLEELYDWARRIDAQGLERFLSDNPPVYTQRSIKEHIYNLFREVIRPKIMSVMPQPDINATNDIKNGFYRLDDEDLQLYRKGMNALATTLRWNDDREEIQGKMHMGEITKALVTIQKAKAGAMIRVAKQFLRERMRDQAGRVLTPKVILYSDYYDVIDRLLTELKEYNPLELTGRVTEDKRNKNIDLFQAGNDEYRLLIGNPVVGGVGINLHDTTGLFPRIMLIMPGYRGNELQQTTGRTYRLGANGMVKTRFFYGLADSREMSIMDALYRKGQVMKDLLPEQVEGGVIFPSDYEEEREE